MGVSMNQAVSLLRSVLSDIRAMRNAAGTEHEFGPFSEFYTEELTDGAVIEWPNLAIDADEIEKFLKDAGELA